MSVVLPAPTLATLVYCVRDGKVLLLKRKKPPYPGYWVAPGGKIELGESPHEGALRELREETGLMAKQAELRAIITETSPHPDWQWLIFMYRVLQPVGDVISDQREGELSWFAPEDFAALPIPEGDQIFMPRVLGQESGVWEARFVYDENLALQEVC
jgi:ADP-ribose pyrophosphatase YjhB (NUDIX family)